MLSVSSTLRQLLVSNFPSGENSFAVAPFHIGSDALRQATRQWMVLPLGDFHGFQLPPQHRGLSTFVPWSVLRAPDHRRRPSFWGSLQELSGFFRAPQKRCDQLWDKDLMDAPKMCKGLVLHLFCSQGGGVCLKVNKGTWDDPPHM